MLADVQWNVLADFSKTLFKTKGIRITTSAEREAYNHLANLYENVVPVKRLTNKAGKNIGECTDFLEDGPDTLLTPRDIWTRLLRELAGLYDFERGFFDLEGRVHTAIVTSSLLNACVIFTLINEYSQAAAGRSGRIRLIKLADGGMLKLAALARRAVT